MSPAERALGELWAKLLDIGVDELHPDDNFFDLGGDSLRAMQAVELSAQKLGVQIDAQRYLHETLSTLAATPAGNPRGNGANPGKAGASLLRRLFGGRKPD